MTEIVPGLSQPSATTGHLIAPKLLARDDQTRPQDFMDLRALRKAHQPPIALRLGNRSAQDLA
jgi:hypothetical protein